MAKYDPLAAFLRRQRHQTVELSFREIENLIGALLPNAAASSGWWQGVGTEMLSGVQHAAWSKSGYRAELLKGGDRVRFAPQS